MLSPAEERPHGTRLTADGLYAPGHQHFFVARLHMDVDGGNNTLHELSVQRDPRDASANAFGGAFRRVERELRDSAAARRLCDPAASRHWEVRSAERNRAGGGVRVAAGARLQRGPPRGGGRGLPPSGTISSESVMTAWARGRPF